MSDTRRRMIINEVIALAILAASALVVRGFLLPMAWAAVLAIATWPTYVRIRSALGGNDLWAAAVSTVGVACLIGLPLIWLAVVLGSELQAAARFLSEVNTTGWVAPPWLGSLPVVGYWLLMQWNETLAKPNGVATFMHVLALGKIGSFSVLLRHAGFQLMHRLVGFGFSVLTLFFLYKDGSRLTAQIHALGSRWLEPRWQSYAISVPSGVRATVNGLVFVGIGEGVLIGVAYALAGTDSPALLGAVTAVLAIIPFGAPLVFGAVSLFLAAEGRIESAILVLSVGLLVLAVADHFVRPILIGNATRLPFLAVLFGILGGIETIGLVGLFLGPVLMILFMMLWREAVQPEVHASQITEHGLPGHDAH
ncbi:MAG: AI-2E family transporter [Betaproteobacteria bacterium]|nr:AI-2E family transporter [Betaproteobacteria bacterium]